MENVRMIFNIPVYSVSADENKESIRMSKIFNILK